MSYRFMTAAVVLLSVVVQSASAIDVTCGTPVRTGTDVFTINHFGTQTNINVPVNATDTAVDKAVKLEQAIIDAGINVNVERSGNVVTIGKATRVGLTTNRSGQSVTIALSALEESTGGWAGWAIDDEMQSSSYFLELIDNADHYYTAVHNLPPRSADGPAAFLIGKLQEQGAPGLTLLDPFTIGLSGDYLSVGGGGWNVDFTASLGVVPEPSSVVLLGMGAVGLLGFVWRRRMRAA